MEDADFRTLRRIQAYRYDVYMGAMKNWEEYCYQPFDDTRHLKVVFAPQDIGFYVRCFTCVSCNAEDGLTCHAAYHHHIPLSM